jgi:methionyl-tRNA synthetase
MKRQILVTSALPYANGPIHLGHLVEYLQTDIWVRFQKLRGHRCVYVCADDTHGTAIMIRARLEGRSEEALIAEMKSAHERDFAGFGIEFDNYGSTHSQENRTLCAEIWQSLRAAGLIVEKTVTQLYDPEAGTFLADRFVKGTCPKCQAPEQFGDNCTNCLSTYEPTDLIDPVSTLSGATPEIRSAPHLFVELQQLHGFLTDWTQSGKHLQPEVANYLAGHFLGDPLRDWDVSRPAPYFGFEIPDSPGNYWYVWFDAPIGYMASTKQWCDRNGEDFADWWKGKDTEIHHFIGKDITYFHTLFWPGMLKTAGFTLPTRVQIHGFLTVDGRKMSKRDGTFIKAATYLNHLDPSYLRYYYASKLGPRLDDLDLNLTDFISKVDSDLVGKVVNLASRTAKFAQKTGLADRYPDDGGLFEAAAESGEEIAAAYESCDFNKAMRLIMDLANRANPYVESKEPWVLNKDPQKTEELRDVCTVALNLFRQLAIYLTPVLPRLARQTGDLLNDPIVDWDQAKRPLLGTQVNKFKHMLKRVDPRHVEAMVNESKEDVDIAAQQDAPSSGDSDRPLSEEPLAAEISFEEFAKVDLRVVRIVAADDVPEARKLLKLTLSLGGNETRTVFAGIKQAYQTEQLVGRLAVMAANLAPRRMKFGTSEGMIVAAGPGGNEIFLLAPDEGALPGQRVH